MKQPQFMGSPSRLDIEPPWNEPLSTDHKAQQNKIISEDESWRSDMEIEGFDEFQEGKLRFFRSRIEGPGVMLMHELPGMTPSCIGLAKRLAWSEGFRVYLPLLYGEPGDDAPWLNLARICVSREFHAFATGKSSPITVRLRQLGQRMVEECQGDDIGVIGMCLTGGFVLSMLADKDVVAGVCCQPALPFAPWGSRARSLGVSQTDLDRVKANAQAHVIGLRFSNDRLCPPQRFEALRALLQERFEDFTIPATSRFQHSTLTQHYREAEHRTYYDEVVAFLHRRLGPASTSTVQEGSF